MYFDRIAFRFQFFHNSLFCEKAYNWKLRNKKSFVNKRTTFFTKFKIMQWNGIINKQGFLNQHLLKVRSSCLEVFCKEGVLRNFAKFTEKHLCQSLLLQASGLQIFKKESLTQVFSVNFAKFLFKMPIPHNIWHLNLFCASSRCSHGFNFWFCQLFLGIISKMCFIRIPS